MEVNSHFQTPATLRAGLWGGQDSFASRPLYPRERKPMSVQ